MALTDRRPKPGRRTTVELRIATRRRDRPAHRFLDGTGIAPLLGFPKDPRDPRRPAAADALHAISFTPHDTS